MIKCKAYFLIKKVNVQESSQKYKDMQVKKWLV